MDKLRKETDKELKKIEDELARIYSDAEDELREKWTKYFDRAEKRVASFGKAYEDAVKSGDADAIAAAKKQLQEKIASATFRDKQFQDMIDGVTERMSHVNQIALEYVNGKMPDMYRYNYNGTLNAMKTEAKNAGIDGVAFNLLDEKTVERMVKRGEVTLPKKKIDVAKDKAWNKKAINSQLMQGIIQGESIPQMSKRFEAVTDMDKEAAIRNARTMTTEAENGGRMDSMRDAEEMGLQYEKVWMSTHDARTRESHVLMDGVAVPLDEPFILQNSDGSESKMMYPGDPNGAPEQVYNCRCSLVRKLVGFKGKHIDAAGYEPTYFDDVQKEATMTSAEAETEESEEALAAFGIEQEETEREVTETKTYTDEEIADALERFTSDQYTKIRKASNGEQITATKLNLETRQRETIDVTERYQEYANAIEQYIAEDSVVEKTLYRGITVDDETLASFQIGQTINQRGISSWTTIENTAKNFGAENEKTPNKVIFVETEGTKHGRDVTEMSLAKNMDKNEVLQSAKAEQEIEKIENRGNVTYIFVRDKKE